MQNKKQNSSPGKFARALGIPDVAARHLLNKKHKPMKPHPRKEYRPGIRSILRGPSIYDLPNTRRSPHSQSPDIEPETQSFSKKPSLYDLILNNSSSKNKMDMFKIFSVRPTNKQKEISKEVETDDDSFNNSLFFTNKMHLKTRTPRLVTQNRTQSSIKSPETGNMSLFRLQPKGKEISTLLSERASLNRTADEFYNRESLEEHRQRVIKRAASIQKERVEKLQRKIIESRNPSTAKSSLGHTFDTKYDAIKAERFLPSTRRILQGQTRLANNSSYTPRPGQTVPIIEAINQSHTPARAPSTSRDTQLPQIEVQLPVDKLKSFRQTYHQNLDMYALPVTQKRDKLAKRSASSEKEIERKDLPPPLFPRKSPLTQYLPFSQYYEDGKGRIISYFGNEQKRKLELGLMSYAGKETKVKSSSKLQKQRILLVESKETHKRDQSPSESPTEATATSALGLMDIGKLAGSRTQLEAIKVMNENVLLPVQEAKLPREEIKQQEHQQLPFKFQQRTKSQQPGNGVRQTQRRMKHHKIKNSSQRAAFSISDIVEMQAFRKTETKSEGQ